MGRFRESITADELKTLQLGSFSGEIVVVDHSTHMGKMVELLQNERLLGFDTETKPSFKKGKKNKLAIIQLSTADVCFLIRINSQGVFPEVVNILTNPSITKVGISLRDDMAAIHTMLNFKPGGFIDLQQEVVKYGIEDKSLKKLAGLILGMRISKSQQTSNWEAEVLSDAQKLYAATDAWVCREMYLRLLQTD